MRSKLNRKLFTGFYRVLYDKANWDLLKAELKTSSFPDIIRAQLLDDALFFGRKGLLDYSFALDMTKHLADFRFKKYEVWAPVLRHLSYIRNLISIDERPDLWAPFKVCKLTTEF